MGNEVLISVIGLVGSGLSLVVGYFSGRRRNNADAFLTEAGVPMKVNEFYQTTLSDLNKRLEYYILLSEENRKKTYELLLTVDKLTLLLKKHYTTAELNKLLTNEDAQ